MIASDKATTKLATLKKLKESTRAVVLAPAFELLTHQIHTSMFERRPDKFPDGAVAKIVLSELEFLTSTPSSIRDAILAALAGQLLWGWTAFESMLTDLWLAAINHGPKEWAERVVEKPASQTKAEGERGSKEQEKSIPIASLKNYGNYDLRRSMGRLLMDQKKVDFQSLNNARRAYEAAFGEAPIKAIFEKPGHVEVKALEAVRNLYAHRRGVVDGKFKKLVSKFPRFAGLRLNEEIPLDAEMVTVLNTAALRCGKELLRFVDAKLSAHSPWFPVI